jgi:hypothetical protein
LLVVKSVTNGSSPSPPSRDIVTRLFLRAKQPECLVRRDPAAVRFAAIIQSIAALEVAAVKVSAAAECARGQVRLRFKRFDSGLSTAASRSLRSQP